MDFVHVAAYLLIRFLISTFLSAICLWFGMWVTSRQVQMESGATYCSFKEIWIVAVVAGGLALIPWVGWLAAIIAMFALLRKFTEADPRELLIMVLVSRMAAMVLGYVIYIVTLSFLLP